MQHTNFAPGVSSGMTDALLAALIEADGTGSHAYVEKLCASAADHGARPLASLADAAHYLCLLHGRFPGVIDHAATRSTDNAARQWLVQACEAFADERAYITQFGRAGAGSQHLWPEQLRFRRAATAPRA